jgi:hypothetical protein
MRELSQALLTLRDHAAGVPESQASAPIALPMNCQLKIRLTAVSGTLRLVRK